ncbi:MAG: hypothetical protein LBU83_07345, partial [Bacteroidales bacterium]|nr:hypothetical protein [Bacteroidales bacterium]
MKKLLLSIILILNCQFSIVNSQSWEHSYSYRYFGVKDGLSQSQIITSFQDSYGYMWFATNNGEVNRFDGSRFENWNRKNMQVNSQITVIGQYETTVYLVSMNSILFIYPDKTIEYFPFPDNYFYSGFEHKVVEHHLYLFNLRREAQTNVLQYALFQFDLQNKCFTIVEENLPYLYPVLSDKKIYAVERIIDDGQLKLYRLSDNKLNMIYKTRMEKDDSTIDIQKTSHNDIFGFVTKSGASSGSYYYRCFIENDMLRLDYIDKYPFHFLCVEAFGSERYLVSNQKTISILDMNERKLLPFPLEMDMVNDIWVDRDGNYWFSTEDGIVKCSRAFFESYKLGLGRNDNIWGVVKDSRNNVWFSSFDYGFWRADERGTLFQAQVFHHQKNIPSVNGYMSSCEDSHGSVFLPFDQGVAVFDPRKKSPNRLEAILTGFSLAVYHDAENEITFFGGESDTCITLNNVDKDGKLSSYPFGAMAIMSICRDGNANLRIGTYYGEALFDEKKNIFTTDTNSRSYTGLIAMALDQKGILWKGTTDGLFAEDKQGNDCQITEDEVLFVLNYHDKYIIWLSQSVLHILDLKAFQRDGTINISTFDYYDGFDFAGCVQNAATIDKTGFVWVAGGDKVIRFHPEQLMKLPPIVAQKPYLAAIYFADKNSEWTLLPQNSSIKLKNKENYLRFDILLACVSAPDKL